VTLRPGCRLVVAPSFHLPVDWPRRVLLGPGVEREGDGHVARPGWRPPDAAELALLLPGPATPIERRRLRDHLCLFRLPRHLLSAWWRVAEGADEGGRLPGLDAFVADVAEFLAFKGLPVPEGAVFDLLVSAPGLRSVRRDGRPGLAFNVAAATPLPLAEEAGLWGAINLGDEAAALLFVNLTAPDLLAALEDGGAGPPGTLGELAERFLTLRPDYPVVRLAVEPGEGVRFPAGGLLVDFCTLGRREPDVLLLVGQGGG
jgi:hypothetical protein